MIQLSKEDTLNRYKAYLSKIHPIKPIQKQTQDIINKEVIKAINEIKKNMPNSINQSFHYSYNSPELWKNIVMTYLIQYNNEFSKSALVPFEILDFYRIIRIFLQEDEQYNNLTKITTPILFIDSTMPSNNKETQNIIMQLVEYRNHLPNTKSNKHQTVLLTQHSPQYLRANYPKICDGFAKRYNINN